MGRLEKNGESISGFNFFLAPFRYLHSLKLSVCTWKYTDVSKNRGKTPKMDGENNGKPY